MTKRRLRDGSQSKGTPLHGQDSNFSRLQIKTAAANPEDPATAGAVRDDGFPGSFSGAYAANQGRKLDLRHSVWRITARHMELGSIRGASSDHDQEGHSLCH